MIGALSGFALIGVIVAAGWAVRRWARLPDNAPDVLGRVVFTVLNPCMMFGAVANADLGVLVKGPLMVSTAAAVGCFATFAVLFRRRDGATRVLGALAGGYTNAGYIGIPVATYVLGDASLVVPIAMVQLLIFAPVAMVALEFVTSGQASWRSVVPVVLSNPLVVAVSLGVLVAVTEVQLPALVSDPITTIGQAAVPVVLLAFGMTLAGRRLLAPGPDRVATAVAAALKVLVMPAVALLLSLALGLPHETTYAVTVLAALPTAQNILLYAQRFGSSFVLVRDATFLSTVFCVPVMLLIAYAL